MKAGELSESMNRSNRLFTTGFVDSVMRIPNESPERPSGQQNFFGPTKYLASARRLDKPQASANPF